MIATSDRCRSLTGAPRDSRRAEGGSAEMEITYVGHDRRGGLVSLPAAAATCSRWPAPTRSRDCPRLRRRGLRPRLAVPRRAHRRRRRRAEDTLGTTAQTRRRSPAAPADLPRPSATRCWPTRARVEQPGEYLVYEESGEWRTVRAHARVDAGRAQPRGRRALRRPDRLAPARADRAPARRGARARRSQPQRRVRERRADRGADVSRTATRSSSGATG